MPRGGTEMETLGPVGRTCRPAHPAGPENQPGPRRTAHLHPGWAVRAHLQKPRCALGPAKGSPLAPHMASGESVRVAWAPGVVAAGVHGSGDSRPMRLDPCCEGHASEDSAELEGLVEPRSPPVCRPADLDGGAHAYRAPGGDTSRASAAWCWCPPTATRLGGQLDRGRIADDVGRQGGVRRSRPFRRGTGGALDGGQGLGLGLGRVHGRLASWPGGRTKGDGGLGPASGCVRQDSLVAEGALSQARGGENSPPRRSGTGCWSVRGAQTAGAG